MYPEAKLFHGIPQEKKLFHGIPSFRYNPIKQKKYSFTGVGKLVDPILYPKENEPAQTVIHASIKYNVHFFG